MAEIGATAAPPLVPRRRATDESDGGERFLLPSQLETSLLDEQPAEERFVAPPESGPLGGLVPGAFFIQVFVQERLALEGPAAGDFQSPAIRQLGLDAYQRVLSSVDGDNQLDTEARSAEPVDFFT